jgi:hypothetical protein
MISPFFNFCQWLQDTALSTSIRESTWVFPIIETTHVIALAFSVGTILVIDLRLVGLMMRREPASELSRQLLPVSLVGFCVMIVTGVLLFISLPLKAYNSIFFTIKMALLFLAGVNALVYQFTIYRSMSQWDTADIPPFPARLAGWLSLLLWAGIIAAGRTMAYKF